MNNGPSKPFTTIFRLIQIQSELVSKEVKLKEEFQKEEVRKRLRELKRSRERDRKEREEKAQEWEKRMSQINGKDYLYKKVYRYYTYSLFFSQFWAFRICFLSTV